MCHGNDSLHPTRQQASDLGRGHPEVGIELSPRALHQASDPECPAVGSVQGLCSSSGAGDLVDGDDRTLACLGSHCAVDSSACLGLDGALEYPGDPMEGQRCEVEFVVSGAGGALALIQRIQRNSTFDPDSSANACQEWTAKVLNKDRSGRVCIRLHGKQRHFTAHRVVFAAYAALEYGIEWWEALAEMDESKLEVDHLCTNPPCANIDHLQLLTKKENLAKREWRSWK